MKFITEELMQFSKELWWLKSQAYACQKRFWSFRK